MNTETSDLAPSSDPAGSVGLKHTLKRWLGAALGWPPLWRAFVTLAPGFGHLPMIGRMSRKYTPIMLYLRHRASSAVINAVTLQLSPDLTVLSGPFRGMRYASLDAFGSSLAPKILGTYERELFGAIDRLIARGPYEELHNIGSAEGYYSVGFLRTGAVHRAICYDISDAARELSVELAAANGIGHRMSVEGFCDREKLLALEADVRRLVLSDCEGYEATLFDKVTAGHLRDADVLIEVHDHLGASLDALRAAFDETHDLEVITSVSDWVRADYPEPSAFTRLDRPTRLLLAAELRSDMVWLVAYAHRL